MAWSYLGYMYTRFPRRVSIPEQFTVNSLEELTEAVEKYRKNTRVGASIYNYDGDASKVILDRVVFDIDHDNALQDIKILHNINRKITHFIVFSGKGFHFYMFTQNYNTTEFDKVATVRAVYDHFKDVFGVQVDPSLWQNAPAHMLAIPGTWNSKPGRRKYVIFISEDDLEKGYDHILAKADNPPDEMPIYGNEYFDLGPYKRDAPRAPRRAASRVAEVACGAPSDMEIWLQWQPKAVQVMLTDAKKCTYKSRFYVASFLRERGYTMDAAYAILEHFYSKLPHDQGGTKWDRVLRKDVVVQAYRGPTLYSFPSEKKLKEEGYL